MQHRRQSNLITRLLRNYAILTAVTVFCLDSAGPAFGASLHSFSLSSPPSVVTDVALESGSSIAESRLTIFRLAQTFLELEAPVQSVAAEPVALRSGHSVPSSSSFPSPAILFALVSFGMIGLVSRSETVSRKSNGAAVTKPAVSGAAPVIGVLSSDPVFAKAIETQLRQANYDVWTAGSASEMVAVADPAACMLMVVDYRVQDWDMLRTDPLLRKISLMGVVPRGQLYTEDQCLSDLERGFDGLHDFREGESLFLARVQAYVRRVDRDAMRRGVYQVGAVQLDADAHEVTISGRAVNLSAKPFAILAALMREPSKIFSRRELVDLVWGRDFAVGGHALDVHIHALRQQLDREPDHHCRLMTIKGVGFKLKPLSAVNPVMPVVPHASALLCSVAGRPEGVQVTFAESSVAIAKDWRKPSLRRRARTFRKPLVASHRHAAALAG